MNSECQSQRKTEGGREGDGARGETASQELGVVKKASRPSPLKSAPSGQSLLYALYRKNTPSDVALSWWISASALLLAQPSPASMLTLHPEEKAGETPVDVLISATDVVLAGGARV